jgi:hypothetical protein
MSNTRATDLQERIAWLERQLQSLDSVVRELGDEMLFLRLDAERRGDTEHDDDPETA